jgi:DNA-binding beta-propeller fold protein YncE
MVRDGQVTTVAGSGVQGYADGAALQAQFYYPTRLAISPNGGAIYVADQWNHRIRMIRDGQVTTVAGSGMRGRADGAALRAQFNFPRTLAISPNGGAIYVADRDNNRIRMIRDGQVTTVAGSGVQGYADGAALRAQFNLPTGVAISPNGGAIYVTDRDNNRIRMIRDGQVTTVAGSGVQGYADGAALRAQFYNPTGVAISPNGGAIYVADYYNDRIRMIGAPVRLYETREGADFNIVLKGHNDNTSANNDGIHYDNVRLLQHPRFIHNMHLLKLIDTL